MVASGDGADRIERILSGEEQISLADAKVLLDELRDTKAFGPAYDLWRHMIGELGFPEEEWRPAHELLARADVSDAWERAEEIVNGGDPVEFGTAKRIANVLRKHKSFQQARRLVCHVIEHPHPADHDRRKAHQILAMSLYHDGEYAKGPTLVEARQVLEEGQPIEEAKLGPPDKEKAEHLSIAGSIAKRRFAMSGRMEDLEEAQTLYDAAVEQSLAGVDENGRRSFNDNGYAAINAAFVRELLAARTRDGGRARGLRAAADLLRRDIVHDLERKPRDEWSWWEAATYAEAKLGQGDAAAARDAVLQFEDFRIVDLGEWERESTARQFAALAVVRAEGRGEDLGPEVGELLGHIAQTSHPRYPVSLRGTFGLAFSGGGFRASLFHLGVLARLAELDILRYVAVLSCVSGGSIVGAHYYLALQELLERKPDAEIDREDYIELVRRVIDTFVEGVAGNVRQRAFFALGNVGRKLRSFLPKANPYNRTLRTGELFDELFYDRVGKPPSMRPRPLRDLLVTPAGEVWFNPKLHNWRRAAKVPVLVINATTLNTGNNWQFAATWIGEPDSAYYEGIDVLPDVPRMYLGNEVPEKYRDFPLSTAVGASACVPGVFPPVALPGLLDASDRVLTLADGGLQDNQGLGALIDQDSTHVLVSDASGQMKDSPKPAATAPLVALRSSSVQGRTIRTGVLLDIDERARDSRLHKAWVVHLTKGLRTARAADEPATSYRIPYEVQQRLAALRTDLDAFSEIEANALMLSAYRMTREEFDEDAVFPHSHELEVDWPFRSLEAAMDAPGSDEYRKLIAELELGRHPMLRGLRRLFGGSA